MRKAIGLAKRAAAVAEDACQRLLATVGVRESDAKIGKDSQEYWSNRDAKRWADNAHMPGSNTFAGNDLWDQIGARHANMFRHACIDSRPTVVDWGCGGGMNAVALAPMVGGIIGVDVSDDMLDEAERQVRAASNCPFRKVRIDVNAPEKALLEVGAGTVDAWVSFYVFELIPSPAYGERLLRIAFEMLRPGGLALIQIKYSTGSLLTRSRGRGYRRGLAAMTTYRIDEFWTLAEKAGFQPDSVQLVARDELDERYAYFSLSKLSE
jgi:SAM-dependent methyltransferase